MKKTLSIIALSVIGFGLVSCKKENKEVQNPEVIGVDSTNAPVADSTVAPVTPTVAGTEAAAPVKSNQPTTTIALSESNFDFGNIKKGAKVNHVYEVTNTGTNPLIISEVKPGCGCTAPEFTKEPIMPGKKGKITLSFDSSNFDGSVQKYADVFANVENAPVKLTFNANIQP
ncbi:MULTISPECIES: DUF1573 domain-containing protein [Chryseobacterium]|jgi:hypothetical protein|uniref:DUF1573 domain-containing protein n=1 Tax=Chryseobacterium indoltheticum TaxID=254 RepID=A0A381JQU3_9FLAO|nr:MULTISPECIES: DUF1573 domain-containing protein [Chryseobacterium]AZA62264.1 DUF1573 domain-containing protein [Chryseobacterium indoltheticum]AZA75689.1 DUF1573 domain-containing protein [Chryseobacterium indoltheticum]MDQ8143473.1 DUF1573 domain-containing protein [Chryseobacterium sp. CFS15]SIQ47678.1 Protein of unknown function [Chryseobacterium indoltheticum]SUY53823.1 Protein of uncharacterised function (DUF1573) [Chryseobacterium indoltheticum]